MKKFKVGDNIVTIHNDFITSIKPVTKVTERFAFVGTMKFRIEFDIGGFTSIIPREKWSMNTYKLATEKDWEKLENQNKRARLVRGFDKLNVKNLSNIQLEDILRIAGVDVEKV
jgi:hypothetical protein